MKKLKCISIINQGTHKQIVLMNVDDEQILRYEIFAPVTDNIYEQGKEYNIEITKVMNE